MMQTLSRRTFLGASAAASFMASAPAQPVSIASAPTLAADESYWAKIAAQYDLPSGVIQLENGNWGVMSRPVLAAYERHQRMVNQQSSYYTRREYGPDFQQVRERVANALGVGAEEIALTRNATEALQALIGGYNRLRPGDAVLYADLDYDSMQAAMNWLRDRRGVEVIRIALPEPASYQGLIDAYEQAFRKHPRIKLALLTHLSHRTGLVLPVKEIIELARTHSADAIVDSAHAWGQLEFRPADLGIQFMGVNLHKWMGVPLGVGAMYIRRDRIADIDPFMANDEVPATDIRARVHTGTANFAAYLTVPDAFDFHEQVGGTPAKAARLRHLRSLWVAPLRDHPQIQILTPDDPRLSGGITSFRLRGRESVAVAKELLERHKIFTVHRVGVSAGPCVRVTPGIFNSADDLQKLVHALKEMAGA
ncbi:aminotransferase class V-fold PLP-dependent enzyme [Steroidobacter cummioxidans]|uniref:aminotransferase class V-fold PLP-dependent enzyme n=1 Tax=Steroidobacter cummioxidans TaxID=1803913 RepID=UPI000E3206B4|nr:aminotransferase class V-fold PLP-dependent enzyme [Steroidobacter cummioxidans]